MPKYHKIVNRGADQGVIKFHGKFRMGAYLNMFHAVTCQKQNEMT